jgi:hypothetical protein
MSNKETSRREFLQETLPTVAGIALTFGGFARNVYGYANFDEQVEAAYPEATVKNVMEGRAKAKKIIIDEGVSTERRKIIAEGIDQLGEEAMKQQKINLAIVGLGLTLALGRDFIKRRIVRSRQ